MNNGQREKKDAPRKRRKRQTQQRFHNARHGQRLLDYCVERWGANVSEWPWARVVATLHADTEWRQWEAPEAYWRARIGRAIKTSQNGGKAAQDLRDQTRRLVKGLARKIDGTQNDVAELIGIPCKELSNRLTGYKHVTPLVLDLLVTAADGNLPRGVDHPAILDALMRYQMEENAQSHEKFLIRNEAAKQTQATAERVTVTKPEPMPQSGATSKHMIADPNVHAEVCRTVLAFAAKGTPIKGEALQAMANLLTDWSKTAETVLLVVRQREGLEK